LKRFASFDIGPGAMVASLLAYSDAMRANNAVTGGSLIPMLTLGIPGDTEMAALNAAGYRLGPT
jgi:TctA family transporter